MKGTGTDGYRLVQSFRWSVAAAIHFIGRRNVEKMGGRIERTKTSQKTQSPKEGRRILSLQISVEGDTDYCVYRQRCRSIFDALLVG